MIKYLRKGIAVMLILIMTAALSACSGNSANETSSSVQTTLSQIDMSKWQYNEDDDVYYQIGISYCENPADESYETLAVFVPGAYMTGTDNGDGTYTCELDETAELNGYTAPTSTQLTKHMSG